MNSRIIIAVAAALCTVYAASPRPVFAIPHADAPVTDESRDSLLPTGTLLRIALKNTVSTAHCKAGQPFAFAVVDDVKIGDRVAIAAGAPGTGKVVRCEPAHGGRVDGILKVTFDPI
jgi:hypothetical protein